MTESKEKFIAASGRVKESRYWLNQLAGDWEKSCFPHDEEKSQPEDDSMNTVSFIVPDETFHRLCQISKKSDYTLNVVLQAVLIALLNKYTGSNDIVVGTVIYKQENKGKFINTVLVLRNQPGEKITFKNLLLQVRQTLSAACEHQNYPVRVLAERVNRSDSSNQEFSLFDVAILLENIHDKSYLQSINHNMTISFLRKETGLNGTVAYNDSLYRQSTIERIITHFNRLLHEAIFNLEIQVSSINILSEAEIRQLVIEFNNTTAEYPQDSTMHQLFAEQSEKHPDSVALEGIVHEVPDDPVQLTYRELNEKSDGLAHVLIQEGVRAEDMVGIIAERSIEMIIGILGILKAGGAYMPIDPGYPAQRIRFMLVDSCATLLLATSGLSGKLEELPGVNCQLLMIDEKPLVSKKLNNPSGDASPLPPLHRRYPTLPSTCTAYTIYTSGSTGRPKGVLVEHRSAVNMLVCRRQEYNLGTADIALQLFSFAFDGFVTSFFTPVISGAKVVLLTESGIKDAAVIKNVIVKNRITHFISVPALYRAILENISAEEASSLKVITLAGDRLSPDLLEITRQKNKNIEIAQEYGVTESSVMSTIYRQQQQDLHIKIGPPIWNTKIFITDNREKLQPLGVPGEMCIAGPGIARGYMNNPGLTAEKFIELYVEAGIDAGISSRFYIYKTGDLARWLPEGNLEFLGRIDQQVKIRGFRIEVGEIETQLQTHQLVNDALVIARKDENRENYLCAYIISETHLTVKVLKEYLSGRLPAYMIPAYFIRLGKIPLTSNGKVDRKALENFDVIPDRGSEYAAPGDELEKTIVAVWQEVLQVEKLGIHDNFFELGGDSFKAMSFARKLEDRLGEMVSIVSIFDHPTTSGLARYYNELYPHVTIRLQAGPGHSNKNPSPSRVNASIVEQARQLKQPFIPGPAAGTGKNRPVIFILSPRRSGSTLLRVILAGHPELFAPQELDLMQFHTLEQKKDSTHTCVQAIMQLKGCSVEEAQQIMQQFQQQGMTTREFYRYLQQRLGHRILVDKTPAYTLYIDVLNRAETGFENPLYLHLLRHPYGMIRSFQEAKFNFPENCQKWQELALSRHEIAELEWTFCHRNILTFLKNVPRQRQFRVNFDELVKQPHNVVKGICRFLNIEFHPGMLEPYKEKNQRMTDGLKAGRMLAGDPKFHRHKEINAAVADTWKKYYTVDFLAEETWKLANLFGYKPIGKNAALSIRPVEKKEYYPLASAQSRYYVMEQLSEASMSYHISNALELEGKLEKNELEKVFIRLIQRHESLRTSFETMGDDVVQVIHEQIEFQIQYHTPSRGKQEIEEITGNFMHPFDLSCAPLFRIGLIKVNQETHILIVDMHHLITDGISLKVFIEEFTALYARQNLPELHIQYKDYAQWQKKLIESGELKKQEDYWLDRFKSEIPVLNMPTDYPVDGQDQYEGSTIRKNLDRNLVNGINRLLKEKRTSLNILALAAYTVLLSKYTGQEDIIIGSLTTGRNHEDLQQIIGLFTNSLAIRNFPHENKRFNHFLDEVKKNTLEAYENQDYQFNDLVWKLGIRNESRGTPLFSTLITLQDVEVPTATVPGLTVKPYPFGQETSKFALYFDWFDSDDSIVMAMMYSTALYKSSTAEKIVRHYIDVLEQVVKNREILLKDIKISMSIEEIETSGFTDDPEDFNF